jgi:hypothetical protein
MIAAKLTLNAQLVSLVSAVVAQQYALDADYRQALREFRPVWRLAQDAGLDAVARAVMPSRLVATEATIECGLFVMYERASGLRVSIAGLGLQKRYARTTQAHLQLRCSLTAPPRSPRAAP